MVPAISSQVVGIVNWTQHFLGRLTHIARVVGLHHREESSIRRRLWPLASRLGPIRYMSCSNIR